MTYLVVKPKFERGDRTSVAVYHRDMVYVEQALEKLSRENPGVRVAAPDAMRALLKEGWRALGEQR